eukprot:TRINITY_DN10218_c0_g1_i1.p1 TRINITY_DN10218_c0_g1~~TRINITY_DN10218_c0_g1_i1.p1  ORF type:complete len:191 (+),score=59.98 TRINITY_DN10218_c0_g1_i1:358-930(+)
MINKYGRVIAILCASSADEKEEWIAEFTNARQAILTDEKKKREDAVKKSTNKAALVKELLSAQYETGDSPTLLSANFRKEKARFMTVRSTRSRSISGIEALNYNSSESSDGVVVTKPRAMTFKSTESSEDEQSDGEGSVDSVEISPKTSPPLSASVKVSTGSPKKTSGTGWFSGLGFWRRKKDDQAWDTV